ncbi:MAG: metallophosphoesterase [Chloroflexota bacterium]
MERSPEDNSLMHRTLTTAAELQSLPSSMVALSFVVDSALVAVFWTGRGDTTAAWVAALGVLLANFINWELLRRLPKAGRSFGPDKPAALALGGVMALVVTLLGLFGVSFAFALLVVVLISALAYYATWIEPFALGITRQRYSAKTWQGTGEVCLRVLHIADIHVERTSPRERELVAMIEHFKPDLIVFSGDFVNISYTNDAQAKADIRTLIGAWHAPLGVYCVPGTPEVEPLPRVLEFVQGLDNLNLLANRWVTIETPCGALHILGMITTHILKTDRDTLARMMQTAPDGGIKLLLTHSPDIAPEAARAGIDLYLCGHTHGGQVRLPLYGALLTSSQLGKRFEMGRYELGGMTLYTSRGVGLEGHGAPRARLFCPPEVTLWEIASAR